METVTVTFLPAQIKVQVDKGTTILQAAKAAGLFAVSYCGAHGRCGKCKVRLLGQHNVAHFHSGKQDLSDAEILEGWRLACSNILEHDVEIFLPPAFEEPVHSLFNHGYSSEFEIDPYVHKRYLTLEPPDCSDGLADFERVSAGLGRKNMNVDIAVLSELSHTLRESEFKITAVMAGESLVSVESGNTSEHCYGLAFDIGSTTVVGWLMDLTSGRIIGIKAATNGQTPFGADIISRIEHSQEPGGLHDLMECIRKTCEEIIRSLLQSSGISGHHVYAGTIAGNSAMIHLLLGIDPAVLVMNPYVPTFTTSLHLKASEIDLRFLPNCTFCILPGIGGYVGADTVSMMLALELDTRPGNNLAIDIGTNGEIVLAGKGKILACSTAAGPALEGARIFLGMRASSGAIQGLVASGGEFVLDVVGDVAPKGICGSGIIDAVAEMTRVGLIDTTGRIQRPDEVLNLPYGKHIRHENGERMIVLAGGNKLGTSNDIILTQKDIREVQLAKAAIAAGIQILLDELDLSEMELDRVFLAGAFGSNTKPSSALRIGLLPQIMPEIIINAGNAAGVGAISALLSRKQRSRALQLAGKTANVSLAHNTRFMDLYLSNMYFPKQWCGSGL